MKTIAIVQARMSSSRLPGKVMEPLAGVPMIHQIVNRAKYCKLVDEVIVATSTEESDDLLVEYCIQNQILFYRGSLNNVLKRFIEIIKIYKCDYIVRITGDCPLIDPYFIDLQIKALTQYKADAIILSKGETVLCGQGVLSSSSLLFINERTNNPLDLEHVGSFYYLSNNNYFKWIKINVPRRLSLYTHRITVDEIEDLLIMQKLYSQLYNKDLIDLETALKWLDNNKKISESNNKISDSSHNQKIRKIKKHKILKFDANINWEGNEIKE